MPGRGDADKRRKALEKAGGCPWPLSQTSWQEIRGAMVDELSRGMVLKPAVKYQKIHPAFRVPRDDH